MSYPRILDTNRLIRYWRRKCVRSTRHYTVVDARGWAQELVELEHADAIVTPIEIEFLGGVRSEHELTLAEAFLGVLPIVDGGDTRHEDWRTARQFACRGPKGGRHRDFGDCLIRAIARRLRYDVDTGDQGIPR